MASCDSRPPAVSLGRSHPAAAAIPWLWLQLAPVRARYRAVPDSSSSAKPKSSPVPAQQLSAAPNINCRPRLLCHDDCFSVHRHHKRPCSRFVFSQNAIPASPPVRPCALILIPSPTRHNTAVVTQRIRQIPRLFRHQKRCRFRRIRILPVLFLQ